MTETKRVVCLFFYFYLDLLRENLTSQEYSVRISHSLPLSIITYAIYWAVFFKTMCYLPIFLYIFKFESHT